MNEKDEIKPDNRNDSFRDSLSTVDKEGRRNWIFAQQPKGKFYTIRTWLSYVYFIIFFSLPFIKVDGRPLFMLNIPKTQFILFGKIFWPQDFFLLALTIISGIFCIVLFTAAFGRLFCGWICPQTNFMEMMFRKIEYLILGNINEQKALKKAPWTGKKIFKTTLKHVVFYALSFIIANFFLSYIIGMDELKMIITDPISEHLTGLLAIILFSAVFYGVFAFFREQACTVVCPYGRLQSVLLDKNSMIVAYDYKRGEPRGNAKKQKEAQLGDCIDCHQCVRVCPTGIDIRNGVQMECVGCTACIDACDDVMDKISKPRGLIRYASETTILEGKPLKYTTRMKLYTFLCIAVLTFLSILLFNRKDIDPTIIRAGGEPYYERGTDSIANLFVIKIVNKTARDIPVTVKREDGAATVELIGKPFINMPATGQAEGRFFVVLPKSAVKSDDIRMRLGLYEKDKKVAEVKVHFLGPVVWDE